MGHNGSLDFLDMIKNTSAPTISNKEKVERIAVIDTETNWHNQLMSMGIAIADKDTFKCLDKRYYIFEPECYVGGMYSNVLRKRGTNAETGNRKSIIQMAKVFLDNNAVSKIFAYNAKFDHGLLPELRTYEWYDIMRLAAYKQYNKTLPETLEFCKTGRLKTGYGVEPILRMLSGNASYEETHNAVLDAVDELMIMELLGQEIGVYNCGRL